MNYHNITDVDMLNGSGLRTVLWVSGCNHHCNNCQNPQTWNPDSGICFDKSALEEIYNNLDNDYCSGITFSGGDPLHPYNVIEIATISKTIKEKYPRKTQWLYTGYTIEEIYSDPIKWGAIQDIDVLVDGVYKDEIRDVTLPWCGSPNQRVIDVKQTIYNLGVIPDGSLEKSIVLWGGSGE